MTATVDILIPTYCRPTALAITLTSVMGQTYRDVRIVISDQTDDERSLRSLELMAILRVLRARGHIVEVKRHLPRRGLAEQRQFLLDQATAPYGLFLDDDVILEPDVIARMLRAIRHEACGFVGCAVIGLSHLNDIRPHEQAIEFWDGPVTPETISPECSAWNRHRLHNAANLYHVQQRLGVTAEKQRTYRIAWVGGCVLYDLAKLRQAGGFSFWPHLPSAHAGEDVLAQLQVMARFGGCGLIPSGCYHQQLPTTVEDRRVDVPKFWPIRFLRAEAAMPFRPMPLRLESNGSSYIRAD